MDLNMEDETKQGKPDFSPDDPVTDENRDAIGKAWIDHFRRVYGEDGLRVKKLVGEINDDIQETTEALDTVKAMLTYIVNEVPYAYDISHSKEEELTASDYSQELLKTFISIVGVLTASIERLMEESESGNPDILSESAFPPELTHPAFKARTEQIPPDNLVHFGLSYIEKFREHREHINKLPGLDAQVKLVLDSIDDNGDLIPGSPLDDISKPGQGEIHKLPKSIVADTQHIPNNALANMLTSYEIIGAGKQRIHTLTKYEKKKKPEKVYTNVLMEDENVSMRFRQGYITEFDRQVGQAIIDIWLEAERQKKKPVFTVQDVCRNMPPFSSYPKPEKMQKVKDSIEALRRVFVTIDATEEFEARGIKCKTAILDDHYISAFHCLVDKGNGVSVDGYHMHSIPILYRYANLVGQVISIPTSLYDIKLLDEQGNITGKSPTISAERSNIISYMIRRAAVILNALKNPKRPGASKIKPIILLDTILTEAEIKTKKEDHIREHRNFCILCLDNWTAEGWLSYEISYTGRKITGFRVGLPRPGGKLPGGENAPALPR